MFVRHNIFKVLPRHFVTVNKNKEITARYTQSKNI